MNDRYILIALVAANITIAICLASTTHKLDNKLVKYFAKINDYLEKKVASDDLEDNFDIVKQWKRPKLILFTDKSFKEAQQLFVSLPDTIKDVATCTNRTHYELLNRCDEALSDEAHLEDKNYPLKRIDRILEQVGYRHARRCLLSKNRPRMKLTFKRTAYQQINSDLVDKVDTKDPEANMKAAEEILGALANKDGSYGRALRQLVSLRTILDESSCNEQGTEIVLKNDLATGGEAHVPHVFFMKRINHIVQHYSLEHAKVCTSIYQRNCLARLRKLDVETYRRVLAPDAAAYLTVEWQYGRTESFDDLVAEASGKQVDEDFIVPLIANCNLKGGPARLQTDRVMNFLTSATKQDPRSPPYLGQIIDEKLGKRVFPKEKVAELYDDYIRKPCEKFNRLVGPDMEIFNYHWTVFQPSGLPLHFRLLQSAVYACNYFSSFDSASLSAFTKAVD